MDSFFDTSRSEESPDSKGNILPDLTQKNRREAKSATTAVAPQTHMLGKIVIRDVFENTTVIKLASAELNRDIPDPLFALKKSEGTRIVTLP